MLFPEEKLAPTGPQLTANTCFQTILRLASQATAFAESLEMAETEDGGTGVIATCGYAAEPTIPHRRCVVCRRSGCHATRFGMSHRQPPRIFAHNLYRQSIATQCNKMPVSSNSLPKITHQRLLRSDTPLVGTRPQRNPR